MLDWLHRLPIPVGAGLVAALFLVPTLIGAVLFQPMVARLVHGERDPNAPVSLLLSSFTLYYAVLLALLSIATFENYNKAEDAVAREAAGIITLYRLLQGYPEPMRSETSDLLRSYAQEEIGPGWRTQHLAEQAREGVRIVDALARELLEFTPDRQKGEDVLHAEVLSRFADFVDVRGMRIQAARTSIPPVMWYVVLAGAVINVLVLWLFDLKRTTHFILGGVLSVFIGLVIYMVGVLDHPFRGPHGVSPDDLVYALERMKPRD